MKRLLLCLLFGHARLVTLYRPTGRREDPLYEKVQTCLRCGRDVA